MKEEHLFILKECLLDLKTSPIIGFFLCIISICLLIYMYKKYATKRNKKFAFYTTIILIAVVCVSYVISVWSAGQMHDKIMADMSGEIECYTGRFRVETFSTGRYSGGGTAIYLGENEDAEVLTLNKDYLFKVYDIDVNTLYRGEYSGTIEYGKNSRLVLSYDAVSVE